MAQKMTHGAYKKMVKGMTGNKGALHRHLGIPEGQKIPLERLKEAAGKGGVIGHEARAALTMRGWDHSTKSLRSK